jgi:hypothetical protein
MLTGVLHGGWVGLLDGMRLHESSLSRSSHRPRRYEFTLSPSWCQLEAEWLIKVFVLQSGISRNISRNGSADPVFSFLISNRNFNSSSALPDHNECALAKRVHKQTRDGMNKGKAAPPAKSAVHARKLHRSTRTSLSKPAKPPPRFARQPSKTLPKR